MLILDCQECVSSLVAFGKLFLEERRELGLMHGS